MLYPHNIGYFTDDLSHLFQRLSKILNIPSLQCFHLQFFSKQVQCILESIPGKHIGIQFFKSTTETTTIRFKA